MGSQDMQIIDCSPLPCQPFLWRTGLSTHLLSQTWKLVMPWTAKLVAISLADQANDSGVCWPSVGSMEERTNLGERTIRRDVALLEEAGFMSCERREGRSTVYHLTPANYAPLSIMQDSPARDAPSPAPHAPTPAQDAPIIIKNHQRTANEPSSAFMKWWDVYPKKVGKKPAEKIWRSRKLDSLGDRLIEDTVYRVLNDDSWKQIEFIPHPKTYLNQERWNDEVQKYEAPRRNLSAVERVSQATRAREAERTADKRIVATDDGDLRPQVGQFIRGN